MTGILESNLIDPQYIKSRQLTRVLIVKFIPGHTSKSKGNHRSVRMRSISRRQGILGFITADDVSPGRQPGIESCHHPPNWHFSIQHVELT